MKGFSLRLFLALALIFFIGLSDLQAQSIERGRGRGFGFAGFTPTDLDDLLNWWKTDSGKITIETGVSSWKDEQENLDLVQATTTKQPALVSSYMNGLDGVQFDGIDDLINISAFTAGAISQPYTIFVIGAFESALDGDHWHSGGATNRPVLFGNSGNWRLSAGVQLDSGVAIDADDHYFVNLFNGASSEIRLDGSSLIIGDAGSDGMDGITLGAQPSGANLCHCTIVEIGIIDGALSTADEALLESYLAERSGV